MKALYKKGDNLTPEIDFNPQNSTLSIRGKSISMHPRQFFEDAIVWLEHYSEEPNEHTKVEIDLTYMNARSLKAILDILKQVKRIDSNGKDVMVEWNVPREADDLLEISEEILDDLHLQHHILSEG